MISPYSSRSCFDFGKSLIELERYAQIILTGTVEKLKQSPNEVDTLAAVVRVRRVIKGAHFLKDDNSIDNLAERINVTGLFDSNVCESRVREKDTKIFLLNKVYEGFYRINSSLLAINLKNLDSLEAAVKGKGA